MPWGHEIQVFPNPMKAFLQIIVNPAVQASYRLYSGPGLLLQKGNLEQGKAQNIIHLNTYLPSGIYYLTVEQAGKISGFKMLKLEQL